jgi:hypothetical protein
MNSAWEIDEYHKNRSGRHESALAVGLLKATEQIETAKANGRLAQDAHILRVAAWHHPVTGNDKIVKDAFLEQLRQENIKLCLHGHVHEDRTDLISDLHPTRHLHIAGAGSFGAPTSDRPESTPRLYVCSKFGATTVRCACIPDVCGETAGPGKAGGLARSSQSSRPLDIL